MTRPVSPKRAVRDADYKALAAFRHALRQFLAFSEAAAREAGLTPQQHQALLAIRGHVSGEPVTISDLAAHLLIRHNSAVELVKRLVAAGLVAKTESKTDRRQMLLSLTPEAETILQSLSATHLAELRRARIPIMEMAALL